VGKIRGFSPHFPISISFKVHSNHQKVAFHSTAAAACPFRVHSQLQKVMPFQIMHVAEKPSVAKQLAPHLCSRGTHPRVRQGTTWHTLDFKGDWRDKGEVNHVMTSVRGHLLSQDFTQQYRGWHGCDPIRCLDEGEIETFCSDDMKPVEQNLKNIAKKSNLLVLWTDCDREGEHIGYEIRKVCHQVKPNLQCLRAQFSCCTKGEVAKAVRTLRQIDMRMVQAVEARMEIDLRVGAAFTRFQSLLLQNKYSDLSNSVISYGSCQVPTLGFIVDRQKRIEEFVPEQFWSLQMEYTEELATGGNSTSSKDDTPTNNTTRRGETARFTWQRHRLFHRAACLTLYEDCLDRGCAVVTQRVRKPKSKWRPVPLSTIEMTKKLSRCRHMSAKRIQETAEKLYSKGIISYPRTETEIFRSDFDLRSLIAPHSQSNLWGNFAQHLIGGNGFQQPRRGNSDDNAHPPIHPLKFVELNSLDEQDEKTVYEFIVRHFLACCSKDAIGSSVNIEATIGTEVFTTSGLAIEERNYLDVYVYDRWVGNTIPDLREGDVFVPTVFNMTSSRTKTPLYLSEADLIGLMEKNGIGTDATMGQHIEKIKERQYVRVLQQQGDRQPRMKAEKLGVALCKAYTALNIAFSKPQIRQQMEKDAKLIERGQKTKDVVVKQCLEAHILHFRTLQAQQNRFADALDDILGEHLAILGENEQVIQQSFGWCGSCNVTMCLKKKEDSNRGTDSYLLWCDECNVCLSSMPPGAIVDPQEKCQTCGFGKVKMPSRNNWTFCVKCNSQKTPAVDVAVARCFASSCNSKRMHLQQKAGKWELSCSSCEYVLRMPSCTKKVEMRTDGGQHRMCNECKRVPKFKVTLEGRMEPGEERRAIRCLKCDAYLRRGLNGWFEKCGSGRAGGGGGGGGNGWNNRNSNSNSNHGSSSSSSSHINSRGRKKTYSTRTASSATSRKRQTNGAKARTSNRRNGGGEGVSDGTCPQCQQTAKVCTVRKEGVNQGRQFTKCFDCDVFIGWCDESGKENGKRGYSGAVSSVNNNSNSGGMRTKKKAKR
jgi:DNA topoisomerase-3